MQGTVPTLAFCSSDLRGRWEERGKRGEVWERLPLARGLEGLWMTAVPCKGLVWGWGQKWAWSPWDNQVTVS